MKKKAFTPVKKYLTGFTLAELLIVMVIIAILAMVVIVSYDKARVKARDSKRVSDIANMTSVIRLFYSKNLFYPYTDNANWCYINTGTCLSSLAGGSYIQAWPYDPKYTATTDYYAYYAPTDNSYAILRAKLEDTSDIPNSNFSSPGGYGPTGGTKLCNSTGTNYDYCVKMIP